MPIPPEITAEHVREAMVRIHRDGVPSDAKSTKFDVLDPAGNRLPPKLVLSRAAEIATGRPLSRRNFSGGVATNDRLRELGFEIVRKLGSESAVISVDALSPGTMLTNDQLSGAFSVGNAGGMRWSNERGHLVIIADHTKSLYDDRWEGSVLYYTGMGRLGVTIRRRPGEWRFRRRRRVSVCASSRGAIRRGVMLSDH